MAFAGGAAERWGKGAPEQAVARFAASQGQEMVFRAFSWNPVAYSDSCSDSDTVMTSRDAE